MTTKTRRKRLSIEPATWQEWWRHAKRGYQAAPPGPPSGQ